MLRYLPAALSIAVHFLLSACGPADQKPGRESGRDGVKPGPGAEGAFPLAGVIEEETPESGAAKDLAACRRNLQRIGDALAVYRVENEGSFPEDLRELLGDYIKDEGVFACPVAVDEGRLGTNPSIRNPKGELKTPYTWELSATTMLDLDDGEKISFREFKMLQMKTAVSDKVPVVRCSHHGDTWLNLTWRGEVYESPLGWETLFVDKVPLPYLTPRAVTLSTASVRERLRPRPDAATPFMLDLRPWCTARLEDAWIKGRRGEEIVMFADALGPDGLFHHDGMAFDVPGIIQISGVPGRAYSVPHYPDRVDGIEVNQRFTHLHVLGAVIYESPAGSTVAEMRFHSGGEPEEGNGQTATVAWRYGVDVADLAYPEDEDPEIKDGSSQVAWTGSCELSRRWNRRARLFHWVIENPMPQSAVTTLDFVGGFETSSPFIVGLTLEMRDGDEDAQTASGNDAPPPKAPDAKVE